MRSPFSHQCWSYTLDYAFLASSSASCGVSLVTIISSLAVLLREWSRKDMELLRRNARAWLSVFVALLLLGAQHSLLETRRFGRLPSFFLSCWLNILYPKLRRHCHLVPLVPIAVYRVHLSPSEPANLKASLHPATTSSESTLIIPHLHSR